MDEQGARRLAAQVEREPGWLARPHHNTRTGEWTVKAESAEDGQPVATFTTPYEWHYTKATLAATVRRLKSLRVRAQRER